MKTAISVPDDVFAEAEAVAVQQGVSRSEFYVNALRAFLDASRDSRTTQQLNDVYDKIDQRPDPFMDLAARRLAQDESIW